MSETERRVAIVTGGSHGIGAGLVTAYRSQGWAVVPDGTRVRGVFVTAQPGPGTH
jgi:NAD(P)-dependent dehydrogenase (short-subunit alcohol dehydrogenase family)